MGGLTVRRVWVVGNSGSGKTTLARALGSELGVPHFELDSIYHQPGWTPLPDEEFRSRVVAAVAGDGWVLDGNYYTRLGADLIRRADTVVWIDFPRSVVMRQLVRRTLWRGLFRVELWNGNRESLANFFRRDPDKSILRWAWTQHSVYRSRYEELIATGEWEGLTVVRLRSPAEVKDFLGRVGGAAATGP